MATTIAPDDPRVTTALRDLGWSSTVSVRTLAGGASGSAVYLVQEAAERSAVLKLANPRFLDDARREARFYRELAAALPVRTPRLLAESTAAGALLLSAHGAPRPAVGWSRATWLELAAELGRLHRSAAPSWLAPVRRPEPVDHPFWGQSGRPDLAPILTDPHRLDAALDALPPVLVHGDCHADNLLTDPDGARVWADWQAVGVGSGAEDLALLWQRAEFFGADPPRSAMREAYGQARGIPADEVLRRATDAAELRLLICDWPEHLERGTPERRQVMVGRLARLIDRWAADRTDSPGRRGTGPAR